MKQSLLMFSPEGEPLFYRLPIMCECVRKSRGWA